MQSSSLNRQARREKSTSLLELHLVERLDAEEAEAAAEGLGDGFREQEERRAARSFDIFDAVIGVVVEGAKRFAELEDML